MSNTNGSTRERIHFVEVDIQNFMRIKRAHVFLPGSGVVPVSGNNKAGKTSFMRSLQGLVGGDTQVEVTPRHRDAPDDEESYTFARLSNGMKLRRSITGAASAPKGRLVAKDSEERLLTQRHLSAILGPRVLRPMTFLQLKSAEQAEVLMGFAPELKDELERLRTKQAELEEERRPHNSQLQVLGRIARPEGTRPTPVDTTIETQRLAELQKAQRDRSELDTAVVKADELIQTNHDARVDAANDIKDAEKVLEEAEKLLKQAHTLRASLDQGASRVQKIRDEVLEELNQSPNVDKDIEEVLTLLSQATEINESIAPWKAHETAQADIEGHRAEAKRLSDSLVAIEQRKRDAVAGASLPFTGLGFDDEGRIMIDGSPLSAASGMESARLAIEVAVAEDHELGVVFITGNEFDRASLEELNEFAVAHDIQVLMDVIHSPGLDGEVRMVDGEAVEAEVAVS